MKFKNHYNSTPEAGEVNNKPSDTVPDQTMSVREILNRYAKGLPLGGGKVPVYNGENDDEIPPNWDKLDLSEKMEFRDQQRERTAEIQKDLQDQKNKTGKYKPKESKEKKPLEQKELPLPNDKQNPDEKDNTKNP